MGNKGSKKGGGGGHAATEGDYNETDEILDAVGAFPKGTTNKNDYNSVEKVNLKKSIAKIEKSKNSQIFEAIVPMPIIGKYLAQIPLLSGLSLEARARVGGAMISDKIDANVTLFQQGDPGEAFYIIKEGQVKVEQTSVDANGNETSMVLTYLDDGDYFGEASLLQGCARNATCSTTKETSLMILDRASFEAMFVDGRIAVDWATRRAAVSAERYSVGKQNAILTQVVSEEMKVKTPEEEQLIRNALKENLFFESLAENHFARVIQEMYKICYEKDAFSIPAGSINYQIYVVASGKFQLTHLQDIEEEHKHEDFGPEQTFGDVALMHSTETTFTVQAVETSVCWAIDRFKFQSIAQDVGSDSLTQRIKFLEKVEVLKALSNHERSRVAEALVETVRGPNEVVVTEGDEGNEMYIIAEGSVSVTQKDAEGNSKWLVNYAVEDYFGEKALVNSEKRAATVTTGEAGATLLSMNRDAFSLLLGPLEDIFNKRIASYATKKKKSGRQWKPIDVEMKDLKTIGTLGKGSFGFVTLVKDTRPEKDGKYYALKAVAKYDIVRKNQQIHIINEKQTLCELYHPCLISLLATYKNKDQLFFLLEAGMGGDLFTVLRKRRTFQPSQAKFYAASVVCGFEFMHGKDTIYRDLKPENLLLDSEGYLKITDFGFAKKIVDKTWTMCGTPEYLAPEILNTKGHGFGVDWWTVGILIYELLVGNTPFYDRVQMNMYKKINKNRKSFPAHVSEDARDLINALLQSQPTKRLGVIKGGAKLIRNHDWFKGFDFKSLVMRKSDKLPVPLIPQAKLGKNLSKEPAPPPVPYESDGTGWDEEF